MGRPKKEVKRPVGRPPKKRPVGRPRKYGTRHLPSPKREVIDIDIPMRAAVMDYIPERDRHQQDQRIQLARINSLILGVLLSILLLISIVFVGFSTLKEDLTHRASSLEVSTLDAKINILSSQNEVLRVQIQSIQSQHQVVPFCKMTAPNGQVGIGIRPELLNETCQVN